MIVRDMNHKKTIYLSQKAEDKLLEMSKLEYRTQSNMLEQMIIKYKTKPLF